MSDTEITHNRAPTIDREELLRALIQLSKKEAPELDDYIHYINATAEVNSIFGFETDEESINLVSKLKEKTENEKTLLYDNIKIEGEPIDGKVKTEDNNNDENNEILTIN